MVCSRLCWLHLGNRFVVVSFSHSVSNLDVSTSHCNYINYSAGVTELKQSCESPELRHNLNNWILSENIIWLYDPMKQMNESNYLLASSLWKPWLPEIKWSVAFVMGWHASIRLVYLKLEASSTHRSKSTAPGSQSLWVGKSSVLPKSSNRTSASIIIALFLPLYVYVYGNQNDCFRAYLKWIRSH